MTSIWNSKNRWTQHWKRRKQIYKRNSRISRKRRKERESKCQSYPVVVLT